MEDLHRRTVTLTHFGRKSGREYRVELWFVIIDDRVWIGSLDPARNWVRNLKATGRAQLDFGEGEWPVRCEYVESDAEMKRFAKEIKAKYPIKSRLLLLFKSGKRCVFRTDLLIEEE